ncbi:sulfite exporter TauE/SafE family protein [Idiomarina xiamenensis]|nr:sulfite exporter TauE/SafE family protein [Idiomarina xiamenensis]
MTVPAALLIGLSLGLFGSGGSILTLPLLLYGLQLPAKIAIAASLFIVGNIALLSVMGYLSNAEQRRQIQGRHVLWFGLPGMLGTYLGAWLGGLVDSVWQLTLFSLLMLLASYRMWQSPTQQLQPHQAPIGVLLLVGCGVGVATGFVGVGGGFLIVPALVLLAGLTLPAAIATSLVIIVLQSYSGFVRYWWDLHQQQQSLPWLAMLTIIVIGAMGSRIGKGLGQRLPTLALKRSFAIFLVLMAALVMTQSL